jgi:hypothetical protein
MSTGAEVQLALTFFQVPGEPLPVHTKIVPVLSR